MSQPDLHQMRDLAERALAAGSEKLYHPRPEDVIWLIEANEALTKELEIVRREHKRVDRASQVMGAELKRVSERR